MPLNAALLLRALHLIYSSALFLCSCWRRLTGTYPQPLTATRRRIPKHLAILLVADLNPLSEVSEESLIHSVANAIGWCRTIGTEKLTVYDEHGRLLERVERIRELFPGGPREIDAAESETDFPPTPPPSDCSESLSLSTQDDLIVTESIHITGPLVQPFDEGGQPHAHNSISQNSLALCLASRRSSKQAIAAVASSLASQKRKSRRIVKQTRRDTFNLSVDVLDGLLEAEDGLSAPDFLIVHSVHPSCTPLELHGFPPWHIRLTEIYQNRVQNPLTMLKWLTRHSPSVESSPLDELSFRQALDEFALAEMRFGK